MVRRIAAAILCSMALTAHADTALFDFDGPDSPIFTLTPFALTRSGLTATFVAASPGEFTVTTSQGFATLTGNVLRAGRPNAAGVQLLMIGLSAPQTSVDLRFALDDPLNQGMLGLSVYDGSTFVGSTRASGTIPPGFVDPEGELSFSGAAFDHIFLSPSTPTGGQRLFAIDDLRLEPLVAIPEPGIVWLFATGLLGIGGIVRRHRE